MKPQTKCSYCDGFGCVATVAAVRATCQQRQICPICSGLGFVDPELIDPPGVQGRAEAEGSHLPS